MVAKNRPDASTRSWKVNYLTFELPMVTRQGLEPWTPALKGRCSTNWANGSDKQDILRKMLSPDLHVSIAGQCLVFHIQVYRLMWRICLYSLGSSTAWRHLPVCVVYFVSHTHVSALCTSLSGSIYITARTTIVKLWISFWELDIKPVGMFRYLETNEYIWHSNPTCPSAL